MPVLVKPPAPLAMPLKVVLVLSAPEVSVPPDRVTLPAPVRLPIVWLVAMSSVAPDATDTALVDGTAEAPDRRSVPPLTVVEPA